ncbi:Protein of unknown function [Pyronema omphalodes CBS 100304]|uniref:Uncharacterized protein n=1 Tax=Pyronema omphalodes (strain CBS 100304) TaxID=1076935 RepID=U4LA18_PYROM|nr:Protein of unknown function [Pyronema omphalodes CBS 100304]
MISGGREMYHGCRMDSFLRQPSKFPGILERVSPDMSRFSLYITQESDDNIYGDWHR